MSEIMSQAAPVNAAATAAIAQCKYSSSLMSESSASTSPSITDFLPLQQETIRPTRNACRQDLVLRERCLAVTRMDAAMPKLTWNIYHWKYRTGGKTCPWTYRNESPVPKVIDCAEEPEFVEEQIGSCHSALVWKRQERKENVVQKWISSIRAICFN